MCTVKTSVMFFKLCRWHRHHVSHVITHARDFCGLLLSCQSSHTPSTPRYLNSHRQAASKRARSPEAKARTRSVQVYDGPALFPPVRQPGTLPRPDHNNAIPISQGNVGREPLPKKTPPISVLSPEKQGGTSSPRTAPIVRVTSDDSSPTKTRVKSSQVSPRTARASEPSPRRSSPGKTVSAASPRSAQRVTVRRATTSAVGVGGLRSPRSQNIEALATMWTDAVERLMSESRYIIAHTQDFIGAATTRTVRVQLFLVPAPPRNKCSSLVALLDDILYIVTLHRLRACTLHGIASWSQSLTSWFHTRRASGLISILHERLVLCFSKMRSFCLLCRLQNLTSLIRTLRP